MILEITPELLADLFTSPTWIEDLLLAANATLQKDKESGLETFIDGFDAEMINSRVTLGTDHNMSTTDVLKPYINENNEFLFIFLHYHPGDTGPCVPSDGDLMLVFDRDIYISNQKDEYFEAKFKGIYAIARAKKDGGIQLLIYQERYTLDEGDVQDADEAIEKIFKSKRESGFEDYLHLSKVKTKEIAELLNNNGYKACIIDYPSSIRNQNGIVKYGEKNYDSIRNQMVQFSQVINFSEAE